MMPRGLPGTLLKSALFALVALIPLGSPIRARAQGAEEIQRLNLATQRSMGKLITNLTNINNSPLLETAAALNEAASALFDKLEITRLEHNDDSVFFASLNAAQLTIEKLSRETDPISLRSTMESLQEDYNAKINASPSGVESNILTRIKVIVKAKKGNDFLQGYNVHCNYKWEFDAKKARFKSNNPTDDAELSLAPGRYLIWLEKDGKSVQKKDATIGSSRSATEIIYFSL